MNNLIQEITIMQDIDNPFESGFGTPGLAEQEPQSSFSDFTDNDETLTGKSDPYSSDSNQIFENSEQQFDFPEESKFEVKIFDRIYKLSPKSLLICPKSWIRANSIHEVEEALEALDGWAYSIHEAWLHGLSKQKEFEIAMQIEWADRRIAAEKAIFARRKEEKDAGTRKDVGSQPTISDLEYEQARLYPNEWKEYQMRERMIKNKVHRLDELHRILLSRVFTLQSILKRMQKELDRNG